MAKHFYMLRCSNMDGSIPCDTLVCAYRETMNRFATDSTLERVTIWKCRAGDIFGVLCRSYTRADFNRVKVAKVNRKGMITRDLQIVKIL